MGHVISIAIAVVEHGGKFLVGRRAKSVPLGGLWEFPGGKIDPDEAPKDAAARECFEETGLCIEVSHRLVVHVQDYDHGRVKLHFFSCRPIDPDAPPHPPFVWVTREALAELHFPEGNRPLLQRLLEMD